MIYVFLPVFAAIFYALTYIFLEKTMDKINLSTMLTVTTGIGTLAWICVISVLIFIKKQPFQLELLKDTSLLFYLLPASLLGTLGYLFTLYAVKNTSASYTAFAEISYPLFTVLFLFLFFGVRQFDWSLLLGGGLVLLGSFILIYGQMRQMS